VFENRVHRRIFRTKNGEVAGWWRKLHNEELHSLLSSLDIGMFKSRWMRWTGHTEEMRNVYKIWLENLKGRDYLEDVGIDRKIISNGS
jgi:hypothetical protein